jgi:hypothetical protein
MSGTHSFFVEFDLIPRPLLLLEKGRRKHG